MQGQDKEANAFYNGHAAGGYRLVCVMHGWGEPIPYSPGLPGNLAHEYAAVASTFWTVRAWLAATV